VFTREDGNQVKDFYDTWRNVTTAAGVPGLLVHDLRRTAARNMRRDGTDRDTIMQIGGWKTDSMFRRYNIVDVADLHEAALKIDRRREKSQLSHTQPSQDPPTKSQVTVVQ
jgi:integrase